MSTNLISFPISQTERLLRWDATNVDLGECVHDDCSNQAMFYITHLLSSQPSMKFSTGEHALKMKRFIEQPLESDLEGQSPSHRRAPMVCAECAVGALMAFIAYGN